MSADVVGNAYSLLSRRTADWSLDQPFSVDQEFFDLEMQLFFGRQWPFVALACEIPRIGDRYRVVRLPFTGGRSSMTLDGRPACSKLLWTLIHRYIQEGSPVQQRSQSDLS